MTLTGSNAAAEELPAQRNLRLNTYSLIFSNLLTGVLGLAFWGAAARLYPAEAVGVGSAVLNSAIMLAALSLLSIDALFERFLPMAGTRTGSLLLRGFLAVACAALIAGVLAVFLGPDELFVSSWMVLLYPLVVVEHALFTLQDKATTGLGVARWAAAKNTFHAVVKLLALIAFAWTGSVFAIVLSWVITAAIAVVVIVVAMRRRCRTDERFLAPPNLPPVRQIGQYFVPSFGLTAANTVVPLVLPLIVLSQFGAVANAHFTIAWAIVSVLYMTMHLIISPFVAEVAAHPDKVAGLSRRMVQMTAAAALLGSLGLATAGPFALGLVGGEYRENGEALLYLSALFIPLSVVSALYEGFARAERKLGLIFTIRVTASVLIIIGSLIGTSMFGVIGVGWAYLAVEAVTAAVLIVPVIRYFRRNKRDPEWLVRRNPPADVIA